MIEKIYNILNIPEINEYINGNIKYLFDVEQKTPLILYNIYKTTPIYYADNSFNYKRYSIQIDIYDKDLKALEELEQIILNVLKSNDFTLTDIQDVYDTDFKAFRKIIRINKNEREREMIL